MKRGCADDAVQLPCVVLVALGWRIGAIVMTDEDLIEPLVHWGVRPVSERVQ